MNKRIIFLLAGLVVLMMLLLGVKLARNTATTPPSNIPISSPSGSTIPGGVQPLSVLSVNPTDGATNIPLNQVVAVTFSRNLSVNEIDVNFGPGIFYSNHIDGNRLFITPSQTLTSGVTYGLVIHFKTNNQYSQPYHFTTIGQKQTLDTGDKNLATSIDDFNRQNHPDTFLANKLPHTENLFSASVGGFKPNPSPGHDYFIVVTRGGDSSSSQNSFISWVQTLGLSNDQIQTLDIVYITPEQQQLVTNLKEQLPYDGHNFSILYDRSFDKTSIIIDKDFKTETDPLVDQYLNSKGIQNRYWINNLEVLYQ